jgi:predicted RNA-binding Zn ribbon-like protein
MVVLLAVNVVWGEREVSVGSAPGDLLVVQQFVNSVDFEERSDALATPDQLRAWLLRHHLIGGHDTVSPNDWRRALEVREALRALAFANNGEPIDPVAARTLERESRVTALRPGFRPDGSIHMEPVGRGVDRALGALFGAVWRAMAVGTWIRFKACRKGSCRWAFFDRSKNRSGTWCSMAVCGNRTKVGAYRRRRSRVRAGATR